MISACLIVVMRPDALRNVQKGHIERIESVGSCRQYIRCCLMSWQRTNSNFRAELTGTDHLIVKNMLGESQDRRPGGGGRDVLAN